MKRKGHTLVVDGQEFQVVEDGFNAESRTVTVLARADSKHFPGKDTVHWSDLGGWHGVARWTADRTLHVPHDGYRRHETLLRKVVETYEEQHPLRMGEPRAYASQDGRHYVALVDLAVPMGLAAVFHETRAPAERAGDAVPIHHLGAFLTHLAREGYAGALWNGVAPVFFCLDEEDQIQFVRLSTDGRGQPRLEILGDDDAWGHYDGAEEIDLLDNQEACDERLVAVLGRQPVLGWPADNRLFTVGTRGDGPVLVTLDEDDEEPNVGLLFTTEAEAQAAVVELEIDDEILPVPDVRALLDHPALRDRALVLNPGSHRARTGHLWRDREDVVLQSFSGFWHFADGGFTPIE